MYILIYMPISRGCVYHPDAIPTLVYYATNHQTYRCDSRLTVESDVYIVSWHDICLDHLDTVYRGVLPYIVEDISAIHHILIMYPGDTLRGSGIPYMGDSAGLIHYISYVSLVFFGTGVAIVWVVVGTGTGRVTHHASGKLARSFFDNQASKYQALERIDSHLRHDRPPDKIFPADQLHTGYITIIQENTNV